MPEKVEPVPRPDLEEYRALLADKLCSGPRMDEGQFRGLLDYIDRCEAVLMAWDELNLICDPAEWYQILGMKQALLEEIRRGRKS